jgi:HD-GYP domain-containing protein (c-di-GMP phosphodiesterase class II)
MHRQIRPEDVTLGMYIRGFGGSWFDHPFWRAKFVLKTAEDVAKVRQSGVPHVVIDEALGLSLAQAPARGDTGKLSELQRPSRKPLPSTPRWDADGKAREGFERQRAKALIVRSTRIIRAAFTDVRLGRAVRMQDVAGIVDEVLESIDRSPRTLLDVLRLKQKDEYTYMHSVAVCTLMVNAARHMSLGFSETRDYGLAGLLHDLGKMGVSEDILNKAGKLTQAEYGAMKDHPEHGYRILSQSPDVPEMALDVCRHHHEKMDGTGYPFGLPAAEITTVARIGAICDVYDAMTSERVYKGACSPVEAVTAMWSWQGHFDPDLLFTFMQSIAVFPPGMLVRLRSNRLALVLENKRRSSRPRVLAFFATRDGEMIKPEVVVIEDSLINDSIVAATAPEEWGIADWPRVLADLKAGNPKLLAA